MLAPELFDQSASNLQSMQITPDGKDLVTASGSPYRTPHSTRLEPRCQSVPTSANPAARSALV